MRARSLLAAALSLTLGAGAAAQTTEQKIAQASRIFGELCANSLPSMSGTEAKVRSITERSFQNSGGIDKPGEIVQGGSIATGIAFSVGSPAWKGSEGKNFCQTTVYGTSWNLAVAAMTSNFSVSKPGSVEMTKVIPNPKGTVAAWALSGTKPGMTLIAKRTPRKGLQLRLAWPGAASR